MTWRERVRGLVDSSPFQHAITVVIVVNAATLGCETSPALVERFGSVLHAVDRTALGIFVVELCLRLYAHRARFFLEPWNCFDFLVIGVSLLPTSGGLSVLRALRILRALRLVSRVPSMRRVVAALLSAVPGVASIIGLLALIVYIAGVMATKLFAGASPEYFGNLGVSLFTLFQVMTGEGWPEVARDVMDAQPMAWIFFVVYILLSTFVVLNLFIGVVVSAMESQVRSETQADLDEREEREEEREEKMNAILLAELRALRVEVEALRAERLRDGRTPRSMLWG
ncbi:MAG: ion transporter [Streptosporangiales bacterium]|nr:ion transporter [Streptosporangiales bacterium]